MTNPYWNEVVKKPSEEELKEEEYLTDIYYQAFVLGMGVRVPVKNGLVKRFKEFYRSSHDGMLPLSEREIYDLIPAFIEHLGKI